MSTTADTEPTTPDPEPGLDRPALLAQAMGWLNSDDRDVYPHEPTGIGNVVSAIDALTAAVLYKATARTSVGRPARASGLSRAARMEAEHQALRAEKKGIAHVLNLGPDATPTAAEVAEVFGRDRAWGQLILNLVAKDREAAQQYDDPRTGDPLGEAIEWVKSMAPLYAPTADEIAEHFNRRPAWGRSVLRMFEEQERVAKVYPTATTALDCDEDRNGAYRDDVRDRLAGLGWTENTEGALVKNGTLWCEINNTHNSALTALGQMYGMHFASYVPAPVIVAACEAAATQETVILVHADRQSAAVAPVPGRELGHPDCPDLGLTEREDVLAWLDSFEYGPKSPDALVFVVDQNDEEIIPASYAHRLTVRL